MSNVRLEGENVGTLVKGKKLIKYFFDDTAKEILKGINSYSVHRLTALSPEQFGFKEAVRIEDFYDRVFANTGFKICEKKDIYLATARISEINITEAFMTEGFASLAMKPTLCKDKKWRILSIHPDFEGRPIIEGSVCQGKIYTKRKFIFRVPLGYLHWSTVEVLHKSDF